jgi:tetratricopeptide (TPR) repeat protein
MISMALTLALLLPTASAQTSQSAATAAALAEINKGNLFEGVRLLKEITRREPSSASAYFYLSSLYAGTGRYETAYRYLVTAMKANPGQGAYYHQLGIIRRYEGCRPEALAAFQQALRTGMGKDEITVWRHVGEVHVDLLAWNEAMEAYANVLQLDPSDARAHLALGRLSLDRNEPERAILELRSALKTDPGLDGIHANLGRAYRALGDLPAAVTILKQGIERNPSDQESRYILGQILLTLGRDDEGRREMEAYRRLQEQITQTDSLFEMAVQRAQSGELDRAEQLFRETLRLAPRYAPALHLMGVVLLNRGNTQRALEMLQQAQAANPLNPEIYFQMASAYLQSGKLSEALDMAGRAIVLEDEDSRYYTLLGDIYSRMNRAEARAEARTEARSEARVALERAAQLKSRPGYKQPDPYASEMRRRDDAATVREICGQNADR